MIKELDLSFEPQLELARDIFLFSFYTRGMSFIDMAHLKKSNLQNGILTYSRKKDRAAADYSVGGVDAGDCG